MSLRYDGICALAYCGWHKSSQTKANQKNRPFGLQLTTLDEHADAKQVTTNGETDNE